jgi:hypothetical protein
MAPAGWCRQVQGFGQRDETDPQVVQFLEGCQQPRIGHVDLAAARCIVAFPLWHLS